MPFFDPKFLYPSITCFSRCPSCKTLIPLEVENGEPILNGRNCLKCGEQVSHEDILFGFAKNFLSTQGVSAANSISGFDIATPIFLVVSVFTTFSTYGPKPLAPFLILCYSFPVILCFRWLWRFRKSVFDDSDIIASRKQVRLSLFLWLAVHFFALTLWAFKFLT
jgi:hypothetical protein